MLWVVLGIALAAAAYVVVGTLADRRLALTATAVPPLPAGAPLPAPPAPPVPSGDTAANAVKVPPTWRDKLAAGKCRCGQPLAIASDESIRYDGRALVVVRLACAACGHGRSVYLDPS